MKYRIFNKKIMTIGISLITIIGYGILVFAAAPPGGYSPGQVLDPACAPGDTDCVVTLPSGGSGWSLTGDAGTDGGTTNFIGTTDAKDFVIKTNDFSIARFGQLGNVSFGESAVANFDNSYAFGKNSLADASEAFAWGGATASGQSSTAFGGPNLASGDNATSWGGTASGSISTSWGVNSFARSYGETSFGHFGTDYTPTLAGVTSVDAADRLLAIGNGASSVLEHNAYTMWKDGSFAYNDDNFESDDPGTEQNMFYFNYGNHDGFGGISTKRAIRMGSALNDEWDIGSANVGDRSIAIGFGDSAFPLAGGGGGPIASGEGSIAFGYAVNASGIFSTAIGFAAQATGLSAIAIGNGTASAQGAVSIGFGNGATAQGINSFASGFESFAMGDDSVAFQNGVAEGDGSISFQAAPAYSLYEVSFGNGPTSYVGDTTGYVATDRLFNIGNDFAAAGGSDALTILKNGMTGIGYDNFETTSLSALLQVNGSIQQTGATGCALVADADGTVACAPSDARLKTGIQDLNYGLATVMQLRPVSYEFMNRKYGDGNQIGFIAQELETVIPEVVTEGPNYKSVNYGLITSVLVSAVQELNVKIVDIESFSTVTSTTFKDRMIAWLGDAANGIASLFAKEVSTERLCVKKSDGTFLCLTGDELQAAMTAVSVPTSVTPVPVPEAVEEVSPTIDQGIVEGGVPVTEVPGDVPVMETPEEGTAVPQTE